MNERTPRAVLRFARFAMHHCRIASSCCGTSTAGYAARHSKTSASETACSEPSTSGIRAATEPIGASSANSAPHLSLFFDGSMTVNYGLGDIDVSPVNTSGVTRDGVNVTRDGVNVTRDGVNVTRATDDKLSPVAAFRLQRAGTASGGTGAPPSSHCGLIRYSVASPRRPLDLRTRISHPDASIASSWRCTLRSDCALINASVFTLGKMRVPSGFAQSADRKRVV